MSHSDLITRDELLKRLRATGRRISARTLQYMQQEGTVPTPVRRWHKGATRALYAPGAVQAVADAYDSRHDRKPQPKSLIPCTHCGGTGLVFADDEIAHGYLAVVNQAAARLAELNGTMAVGPVVEG